MKKILWTLLLIALAGLAAAGESKFTGKDSPLRTLPSMDQRMKWCAEPSSAADRLARYEAFWEIYNEEDGDDDVQGRAVRHCAYTLAKLYLETGNAAKCLWFLNWLQEHDSGFLR
ncbi:MAG: hypothetical protein QOJ45_445 [Verrucomicrobiota bacterium]|jgi:hypothetical protein